MASSLQEIKHHRSKRRKYLESNSYNLTLLHRNMESLTNKLMELSGFLDTGLLNLDVVCFSEHWLIDKQIKTFKIEQYKLADNISKV
jgi:hypothetical protein